jgi:pimeloyl-ACP methyl ester carboxylesterase
MSGIQVFLIIGLSKESEHWDDDFIEYLKKSYGIDENDLVKMDIPGSGVLLDQKTPDSLKEIARKMRAHYHNKIDRSKKRICISVSLGAMIAMEWACMFKEDFEQVVFVNASFTGISPVYKRVQPKAILMFIKIFCTINAVKKEQRILALCSNKEGVRKKNLSKWVTISKTRPVKKGNLIRQVISGALNNPSQGASAGLLFIGAKHDRLAHYSCSVAAHKKWGGDFVLIDDPSVGHGVHIDDPQHLSSIIYNWSNRN